MKLSKSILLFVMCVTIIPLYSQIVIDWTEIPHYIGTVWTKNGKDSVTVDLGSTGGPQTWNFTSQPMGTESEDLFVVPVSSTPFADSFPNANLVYMSFADSDTGYQYYELEPSFISILGLGLVSPDTNYLLQYEPVDSAPLPMSYGDSYNFHFGFSVMMGTDSVTYDHYGTRFCDAYGNVIIPYGNFECLRVCDFDTCVMTVFISGIPIFSDTTTYIVYSFPVEDYSAVVCIMSYPDETNPNYTEALNLERLTYFSTGIEELTTCTKSSFSVYPNPFRQKTEISFQMQDARCKMQDISLKIYDVSGRIVKIFNLTSDFLPLASAISWDGRDEKGKSVPSGVYFYHLKVDDISSMGKILLIK